MFCCRTVQDLKKSPLFLDRKCMYSQSHTENELCACVAHPCFSILFISFQSKCFGSRFIEYDFRPIFICLFLIYFLASHRGPDHKHLLLVRISYWFTTSDTVDTFWTSFRLRHCTSKLSGVVSVTFWSRSVQLTCVSGSGSRSCFFRQWLARCQQKNVFSSFFA